LLLTLLLLALVGLLAAASYATRNRFDKARAVLEVCLLLGAALLLGAVGAVGTLRLLGLAL
jgi:hypothetical protein